MIRTITEIAICSAVLYLMLILVKTQINKDMYFAEVYHKIQTTNRKIRNLQFLNEVIIHNTNLTLDKYKEYVKEIFQKGKCDEKGYQFLMENIDSITNYINNKIKEQEAIINSHTK